MSAWYSVELLAKLVKLRLLPRHSTSFLLSDGLHPLRQDLVFSCTYTSPPLLCGYSTLRCYVASAGSDYSELMMMMEYLPSSLLPSNLLAVDVRRWYAFSTTAAKQQTFREQLGVIHLAVPPAATSRRLPAQKAMHFTVQKLNE